MTKMEDFLMRPCQGNSFNKTKCGLYVKKKIQLNSKTYTRWRKHKYSCKESNNCEDMKAMQEMSYDETEKNI